MQYCINKKSKQMKKEKSTTMTRQYGNGQSTSMDDIDLREREYVSLPEVLAEVATLTPKDFQDSATWWKLGYYLEARQGRTCEERDALDAIFLGVLERLLIWCNAMAPETASQTISNLRDTTKSLVDEIGRQTNHCIRRELVALLWTARVTYVSIEKVWKDISQEGDDALLDVLYYRLALHELYGALASINFRNPRLPACDQVQRRFSNFVKEHKITKPKELAAILPRIALAKKLQYQLSPDRDKKLRHNVIVIGMSKIRHLSDYQKELVLQQRLDLEMPSRH